MALEARNGVMHGEPTVLYDVFDGEAFQRVSYLHHRPSGNKGREVATTLTVGGLSQVRLQLEELLLEWAEVAVPQRRPTARHVAGRRLDGFT